MSEMETTDGPLEGAHLQRATRRFMVEDRAKTWRLLLGTILFLALIIAGIVLVPFWWAKLSLSVLLGAAYVRLFIFFHDYQHGAVLHGSPLGRVIMELTGMWMLATGSVWRETHDYHHRNNAKLIGSSIGSYPVVTTGMWRGMTPRQRTMYRLARHPLNIFLGYFTVFMIGMSISPFRRNMKEHWLGPVALLTHIAAFVAVGLVGGWLLAFALIMLPSMVSCGLGAYLFYVQHNFPDIELRDRRSWDYHHAALKCSSMFDMPRFMHWLTGNIGYHHIHHLNHRIPFYRLPEAYAAVPELQQPGRTTWRPSDMAACLSLAVWDTDEGRMITWSELRERMASAAETARA